MSRPGAPGGRDDGAGTVLALACIGVAVSLALLLGTVAQLLGQRQHCRIAADLAALAAAQTMLDAARTGQPPDGCAVATEAAGRHDVVLTHCEVIGSDVLVTVRAPAEAGPWSVSATARAGPPTNPAHDPG
ncbi:MAG: hypothetical protein CSA58_04685 [Micrococcales bacterium]|nr:MAG: hypothetical protein CSB46_04260 [Micrococcales bacterium]PIE27359.1 MAG: hypothetical protein CSA58_04685 [Micrococcales bacterium]